jgi:hypothetical protein
VTFAHNKATLHLLIPSSLHEEFVDGKCSEISNSVAEGLCIEEVFGEASFNPDLASKYLLFKSVENPSKVIMI